MGSILVRHIAQEASDRGQTRISIPAQPLEFSQSLRMRVEPDSSFTVTTVNHLIQ